VTNNIDEAEREYLTAFKSHEQAQYSQKKAQALKKIGDMYTHLKQGENRAVWYQKILTKINNQPASLTLARIEESLGRHYEA
jgi:uncharacterized FlgJ-related protein|tara:strand:- start:26 stop:271 length:246 start_codon:yes stop_codon:yes gene_type:complete